MMTTSRVREIARVRAHLEGAFEALGARVPDGLTLAMAERRAAVMAALRRYIDAEEYPTNHSHIEMTPTFVDADGSRCALAALLEASGHHDVVQRIARDHNLAYVNDLADDPDLAQWLRDHSVTIAEAARIQPGYANTVDSSWQPTVSVIASAQAGGASNEGAELALAPGVRVGARRVTASNSSCDHCVYQSMSWVAEYTRTVVVGVGATNQIALLMHYDLNEQARDHQFYVMGGPLASLDEAAKPGLGVGAELGTGFSLRQRSFPFLGELVLSSLGGEPSGITVRAGVLVGVVW